ncbi:hypothetical protein H9P43_008402 [Blastocladiella emersonii ATCC 22665]|nr:hypothetical protein H9P43_008402 [Blastocladiella emersonii ATCC 22665]
MKLSVLDHLWGVRKVFARVARVAAVMLGACATATVLRVFCLSTDRAVALRIRALYELCAWSVILLLHRALFSVVFVRIVVDRAGTAALATGFAVMTVLHAVDWAGVAWDVPVTYYIKLAPTLFGQVANHFDFIWSMLVLLPFFKWRAFVTDRDQPGAIPAQQTWSPIYAAMQANFVVYYIVYYDVLPMPIAMAVMFAISNTLPAFLYYKRRHLEQMQRHFDMSVVFFAAFHGFRAFASALESIIAWFPDPSSISFVLLGYRTCVSWMVIQVDETVELAFGVNQLWLAFPFRLAEMLAVGTITLDKMTSLSDVFVYLVLNLAVTAAKDAGALDDLRFYFTYGFSIWSEQLPTTLGKAAAASAGSAAGVSSSVTVGPAAEPQLRSAKSVAAADAKPPLVAAPPASLRIMGSAACTSGADLASAPAASNFPPSSPTDSTTLACPPSPRTTSDVAIRLPSGLYAYTSPLRVLESDLRTQITRSEHSLVGRLLVIACYVLAYCLRAGLAAALPAGATTEPPHAPAFAVARSVAVFVLEIAVARVVAIWVMGIKLARFEAFNGAGRGVRGRSETGRSAVGVGSAHGTSAGGGGESGETESAGAGNSAAPLAPGSGEMAVAVVDAEQAPPLPPPHAAPLTRATRPRTASGTVVSVLPRASSRNLPAMVPRQTRPRHARLHLWSTRMPQHARVVDLLLVGCVFVTFCQYGPWTGT